MESRRKEVAGAKRIRFWFVLVFSLLAFFEVLTGASAVWLFLKQQDFNADQRILLRANEMTREARKASSQLESAIASFDASSQEGFAAAYEEKIQAARRSKFAGNALEVQAGGKSLSSPSSILAGLKGSATQFPSEYLKRIDTLVEEYAALLRIDLKALAALKGRFEDESGDFTIEALPNYEFAKKLVDDAELASRRQHLSSELENLLAAVDIRIHSVFSENERASALFLKAIIIFLCLLLGLTIFFGTLLHGMVREPISTIRLQMRKVSEDLTLALQEIRTLRRRKKPNADASAVSVFFAETSASPGGSEHAVSEGSNPPDNAEQYQTRLP
jgi:hypothetical protein